MKICSEQGLAGIVLTNHYKRISVNGDLIDGVEINCHPLYHTNEKQRVTEFADKYDLRISCGSDYHGDTYKPLFSKIHNCKWIFFTFQKLPDVI